MLKKIKQKARKIILGDYTAQLIDDTEMQRCSLLTANETSKTPKRYDIINYLLQLTENKRYLEIGVRNPADCFDRIDTSEKYSVDPGYESRDNLATFKLTSDEFFARIANKSIDITEASFGVIFLDGLHLADQAYRDMLNSLPILASPGFLVVHDCNPPTSHHAREDYKTKGPAGPYWNGTTWKAFIRFKNTYKNLSFVIDTDWGVGVICKHIEDSDFSNNSSWNPFYEFNAFDRNRQSAISLIAFDQIEEMLHKDATNHFD